MPRKAAVQRNRILKDDKIQLKQVLESVTRSSSSHTPEPIDGRFPTASSSSNSTPGPSSSTHTTPSASEPEPTELPIDNLPDAGMINDKPPPAYKVNIDEKIIVLGLVRHWEITQIVKSKGGTSTSRHSYHSYNGFRDHTAQAMLEDAAPMTLADATTLWRSILEQSALMWNRRGGLKKDYKRWTFKWWAMYKRGPPQLTVDARGSESDYKQRINSVEKRMQGIEASANHQFYIRSHGRVAECYFIYNPKFSTDALVNECYRNITEEEDAKLSRQRRIRHVYGPRVIDMSTENGKYLLNWIFGDICNAGAFGQKLPRYWSIFCGSLAEQPAFEVVLKERPLTKSQIKQIATEKERAVWRENYQLRLQQEAELSAQQKSADAAALADTPDDGPTSVLDNEMDMDSQEEPEKDLHPLDGQDEDDEAAVEMAASSPLTEEEGSYPFDPEMTPIDEDDN